ncbi:MAG TPA: hypothetical protein VIN08_25555 [Ohtaekwangia sp.]|uniref:hypothetical protein n=1 Tax=Ohtaekwangia sp. TaxID=2066019 RepID=UPI002F9497B4
MNVQPLYLTIVRILSEREQMPVEMLAIKTGNTKTGMLDSLHKMEKLKIVKLDPAEKSVCLTDPGSIPSMRQIYALAG